MPKTSSATAAAAANSSWVHNYCNLSQSSKFGTTYVRIKSRIPRATWRINERACQECNIPEELFLYWSSDGKWANELLTNRYCYGSKCTARTSRASLHRYRRIAIRPTAQDRQEKFKILLLFPFQFWPNLLTTVAWYRPRNERKSYRSNDWVHGECRRVSNVGSMNSCQVHNLIDFKLAEEKKESSQIGLKSKTKCKKRWMRQQQILLPMVLTPKMIWKIICKQVSIMIIWHGYL